MVAVAHKNKTLVNQAIRVFPVRTAIEDYNRTAVMVAVARSAVVVLVVAASSAALLVAAEVYVSGTPINNANNIRSTTVIVCCRRVPVHITFRTLRSRHPNTN